MSLFWLVVRIRLCYLNSVPLVAALIQTVDNVREVMPMDLLDAQAVFNGLVVQVLWFLMVWAVSRLK